MAEPALLAPGRCQWLAQALSLRPPRHGGRSERVRPTARHQPSLHKEAYPAANQAWFRSVVTVWASAGHDERAGPPRGVCWTCLERSVPEVAMPFRLEHITLADRVELGCACLLAAGQYGLMTDLAAALGTSRQFLYTLRAGAQAGLEAALESGAPGRPAPVGHLVVDDAAVDRAVLVLSQVAHAS